MRGTPVRFSDSLDDLRLLLENEVQGKTRRTSHSIVERLDFDFKKVHIELLREQRDSRHCINLTRDNQVIGGTLTGGPRGYDSRVRRAETEVVR